MPHSNRKKKRASVKRVEITDENGWTRVTTTDREQRVPRSSESNLDNSKNIEPTKAEEGATLVKLMDEYTRITKQWLASESCKALETILSRQVVPSLSDTDSCIVFGTGSFCGVSKGWISRKHVAMCQLAVTVTIQKIYEETSGKALPVYAQDPVYNDLDLEFLRSVNVKIASTPSAFDLITEKTVVYAPGAETFVEICILRKCPAVLLGGKLNWFWRNSKGEACTNRVNDQATEDNLESDCQAFEAFLEGRREMELPTLDLKDQPFYEQHLYWLKAQGGQDDPGALLEG